MAGRKEFKPVQFSKKPIPKIRFSGKYVALIFIVIMIGFFATYMVLSCITDAFIVQKEAELVPVNGVEETQSISENGNEEDFINPVPKTSDKQGDVYLSNSVFVGDSIISGLKNQDSISTNDVICGPSYTASRIEGSGFTTTKENIYLFLGYTEMGEESNEALMLDYSDYLDVLKVNYPNSNIYAVAVAPVYQTSTKTTNSNIDDFNSKLLELANEKGVHYLDINTILKDNAGNLAEEYYKYDSVSGTDTLSSSAYGEIVDYILYHVAN